MGVIEDIYADLDADVSEEEFREAVEEKVEQMGGLADEETAAMLIAHEVGESEVETVADVAAGMNDAKFVGKITRVGELRTFDRDDGDEGEDDEDDENGADEGHVLNVEVADETGSVRVALWDEQATAAADELQSGQVVRVKGRPKDGPRGLEVSADRVEVDEETDVDVDAGDVHTAASLSLGQSDVNLRGVVLDTESVRTFDRDDGSEGRVANLVLGDDTGRVRVTLWDERADLAEAFEPGTSVEVVDGYVRERDGSLELHVGSRGTVDEIDEDVTYVPDTADIADVEIGRTVDIAGVVRSVDPKRTFDRDDGSEGQVRNVRVQDETGDIRVALWGEKADTDVGPGDEVLVADAEIQDGWQDDLEASAGWRSTVSVLDDDAARAAGARVEATDASDGGDASASASGRASGGASGDDSAATGLSAFAESEGESAGGQAVELGESETDETSDESDAVEVTGTVVQTGEPVMLDTDDDTYTVETDADVHLGEQVTVRGNLRGDRIDADEVF